MISLKKADYEKILAHAKSCVPEEACGLIAGTKEGEDKVVEKVYLLTNIDHSNEHFTPVSYTHLDVYKRQAFICVFHRIFQ